MATPVALTRYMTGHNFIIRKVVSLLNLGHLLSPLTGKMISYGILQPESGEFFNKSTRMVSQKIPT